MIESIRRVRWMALVSLFGVAYGLACDTPARPYPLPPQLEATEYRVSGVIAYEDGRPAAGASVGLAYDPGANPAHSTTTGSDGSYEFRFSQLGSPPSVISADVAQGNSSNIRPLDWAAQSTLVNDMRLRQTRALSAGESIMITIEPDSSLCNWEFGSSMTTLCAWFTVASATVGTITVDARPVDSGVVLPRLGWENLGAGATLSLQVTTNSVGGRYALNLAIPVGAAPQRYMVTTALE